jgi:hypothetical protein
MTGSRRPKRCTHAAATSGQSLITLAATRRGDPTTDPPADDSANDLL